MEQQWSQCSDSQLISACIEGNEKAWQTLIGRYKRLVYSIPIKWGLSPDDAVDVFQAVWLDCFRQLSSLRDVERIQPWLSRVALRKCHRLSLTARARSEDPLTEEDIESVDDRADRAGLLEEAERDQILRTAIDRLTPRCKQIVEYLFFEEPRPSYQTIASRLGLSENSIGFTRERCLNSLRKFLIELGYPG